MADDLEARLSEGNKRGLYDTTKIGPELIAYLDDRRGMLAALRDEMSEGYRGWLDDAVEALATAVTRLNEAADTIATLRAALHAIAADVFVAEPAGTPDSAWRVALNERIQIARTALKEDSRG